MILEKLQKLIKLSINGQEEAQRDLYLMYRVKWYMLCLRYGKNKYEADDILQEGLIQVYKDLHQFDSNRASFDTWSSRLMTHAALRYLKRNSWNENFTTLEDKEETTDDTETIYDQLAAKELTALIQELPTGYRIIFNMYVLEGYKHHEIAERLGISIGTSKSQLSKAKKMLRQRLEFHLTEY